MDCKKIFFYGFNIYQIAGFKEFLSKVFSVEESLNCKDADYLFVGPYAKILEMPIVKNQVRIFFTDEPICADLRLFDYGIGFDYLEFLDEMGQNRYLRFPGSFKYGYKFRDEKCWRGYSRDEAKKILSEKTDFCNFIYGHSTPEKQRETIFFELSKYKSVDSFGTFLNNTNKYVERLNEYQKIATINKYKFTIVGESIKYPGFCTEKIIHAFVANTIPIYFGDPLVTIDFNQKAFIDCNNFNSIAELIEEVKRIDQDDNEYLNMLQQPKLNNQTSLSDKYVEFEKFIVDILSLPKDLAIKRCKYYYVDRLENEILIHQKIKKRYEFVTGKYFFRKIMSIFKK